MTWWMRRLWKLFATQLVQSLMNDVQRLCRDVAAKTNNVVRPDGCQPIYNRSTSFVESCGWMCSWMPGQRNAKRRRRIRKRCGDCHYRQLLCLSNLVLRCQNDRGPKLGESISVGDPSIDNATMANRWRRIGHAGLIFGRCKRQIGFIEPTLRGPVLGCQLQQLRVRQWFGWCLAGFFSRSFRTGRRGCHGQSMGLPRERVKLIFAFLRTKLRSRKHLSELRASIPSLRRHAAA